MLPGAVWLSTSCPRFSNFHVNSKHYVCIPRNTSPDNGELIMHSRSLACETVQATAAHNPAMASLHQRLFDATDGLATNAGYLEASCDPPTFWWDYYDYDVEARWLDDGGTVDDRADRAGAAAPRGDGRARRAVRPARLRAARARRPRV
jgi:hypothetical protein